MSFGIGSLLPSVIGGIGAIGSGLLGSSKNQETKMQKTQRKLIDDLLASLKGGGSFSDLYNADQNAFNKSFVEPAQAMFRNQIAPQIQQQFIAGGQQRGTGLDDQLLRAGVDLDSMLNQQFANYQQNAMNRQQNSIGSILGMSQGPQNPNNFGQNLASAGSGYLSSNTFSDSINNLFKNKSQQSQNPRRGFESDWMDSQLNRGG